MMNAKTVSATEARVHFGEVLRSAQGGPIVVERQGQPLAVVISKAYYDQLVTDAGAPWQDLAARARALVTRDRGTQPLPDPALVLRRVRKAEDERHGLR